MTSGPDTALQELREHLSGRPRRIPPWLFYDAAGSELFDAITRLPEYYLTETERRLIREHAPAIAHTVVRTAEVNVVELGAGTADKTRLLLAAFAARARTTYVPIDVSAEALATARRRIAAELPGVAFEPVTGTYEQAWPGIRALRGPRVALFLGSSLGNFEDADAVALLRQVRSVLGPGDAFVLGADLRKDVATMLAAYDDRAGVTARFNLNALRHLNRAFGADFDPGGFRHVALWNAEASRIEMHLECVKPQHVSIESLGLAFELRAGERLHTENCAKYDLDRLDRLLAASGFARPVRFGGHSVGFVLLAAEPALGASM